MADPTALGLTSIRLQDVEVVSFYNCIAADSRTIVVPGTPEKWLGRQDTPQLKPDQGERVLDYNAGQWKESPMYPAVRAVLYLHPKYDFTKLDLISDRRQLACLLELAFRKGEKFEKTWEGDTVVFVRTDEGTSRESIDNFRGFADDFENQYLEYSDDLEDSKSHHRLISSSFGEIRLLLRHQAEGHVPNDTLVSTDQTTTEEPGPAGLRQEDYDNITVMSGGAFLPSLATIELNTCSKARDQRSRLAAKARQCWLSQSGNFVAAEYRVTAQSKWKARNGGHFTDLRGTLDQSDINFHNVRDDVSKWAEEDRGIIRDFRDLLSDLIERIRAAMSAGQGSTFMVEYEGEGMDIGISPSSTICGISEELSERVKQSSVSEV